MKKTTLINNHKFIDLNPKNLPQQRESRRESLVGEASRPLRAAIAINSQFGESLKKRK